VPTFLFLKRSWATQICSAILGSDFSTTVHASVIVGQLVRAHTQIGPIKSSNDDARTSILTHKKPKDDYGSCYDARIKRDIHRENRKKILND
jgi:hypothetical protein